eukprot:gene27958-8840_t
MPKLSLMGDKLGALHTWSNFKLSLATTEEGSGECTFKEAAAERNFPRSHTCTGVSKNESLSRVRGCQSADTSARPCERAFSFSADQRFFANSDIGPVLESSASPDLAKNWYDGIDSHLISLTSLDDDCTPGDTDGSCGYTRPSMAELMKEAFYLQQNPDDCFLEANFPAHDFHEMVSDLYNASDRANSSPPALKHIPLTGGVFTMPILAVLPEMTSAEMLRTQLPEQPRLACH